MKFALIGIVVLLLGGVGALFFLGIGPFAAEQIQNRAKIVDVETRHKGPPVVPLDEKVMAEYMEKTINAKADGGFVKVKSQILETKEYESFDYEVPKERFQAGDQALYEAEKRSAKGQKYFFDNDEEQIDKKARAEAMADWVEKNR